MARVDDKKAFSDEPQKLDEVEKAALVSDNGIATASLMKPKKPVRHHRGTNFHAVPDDECGDEESCDTNSTVNEYKKSAWYIVSASIFVVASLLYLAMACMIMDTYWFYKDVPRHVYFADDDSTWWNYFINCTDDEHIPENVTYADDDYTWMEWYNNTAFAEDDIVWLPRIANANAPGLEPYVSKYMILYFLAALGFMITGAIEIVLSRKAIVWVRVLYYLMFLAAAFGLVSAILTNKSPLWSNITNLLSTNLWALEAVFIVFQRFQGTDEGTMYEEEKIWGWGIKKWFWVADISFLIGTLGDAITSFFYVFEYDNYKLGISAIVFASMWQICAFVYLAVAIYDWKQYRVYFDLVGKPTSGIGGGGGGGGSLRKEENAEPPGVITTTGNLVYADQIQ